MISDETNYQKLQNKVIELEKKIEELNQSNFICQNILNNLPFGVQIFDEKGISIKINEKQKEVLGLPNLYEGVGKFNVLTDPYSIESGASKIYSRVYNGETVEHEYEYDLGIVENNWRSRKDKRIFKESIFPIYENNTIKYVVAILQDNTELIIAERELQKQNEEYYALYEEYKAQNEDIYAAKQKIEENEEFFRLLVENAPDAIFIQTEGKFSYVNKKSLEIFGATSKNQLIGKPVLNRISPDYKEKVKQRIKNLNENKEIQQIAELVFIKLDGTQIEMETSGIPYNYKGKDGALVFVRDITLRKQLYKRTIDNEQNLDNIFTNSPIGIFVIDIDHDNNYTINSSNPVHKIITGLEDFDLSGKPLIKLSEIFNNEIYSYIKNLYDKIVNTREILSFEETVTMNEKLVQVRTTIKPLVDDTGRVYRLIGTNVDISELNETKNNLIETIAKAEKAKIKLGKRNKKIMEMNDKLKKTNSELDNFVYRVSHDLRAPITSSLGLLRLSMLEKSLDVVHQYAAMQEESLLKLDKFIKDILDYSRNSRMQSLMQKINFHELLGSITEENKKNLKSNIQVDISISPACSFYSDQMRILIILNNIISNAFRYANPYKNNSFINIFIEINEQEATIVVEDNGIGIGKEHQNKIFEMFYRATDKHPGSGIGLYIVKDCIKKLEGNINIESELDEGTRVTIYLPNRSSARP